MVPKDFIARKVKVSPPGNAVIKSLRCWPSCLTKVFILQDLGNLTHRNPSKCLLLLGSLIILFAEDCSDAGNGTSHENKTTTHLQHNHIWLAPLMEEDWQVIVLPLAGVDLFSLCALLAFDIAAPTHLALAGPGHLPALCVMATAATDSITVLVLVTLAGCCAIWVFACFTEAGWVLDVEQVHSAGNLIAETMRGLVLLLASACGDLSLPSGLVGGAAHLDGRLIALLQCLADLVERQELPPTGLNGAGARDTMAFACGLHSGLDYLEQDNKRNIVNHWKH